MSPSIETFETPFRFSPRPNRAAEIPWVEWDAAAFEHARDEDRPVLLALSTAWSAAGRRMDETTFSDQRVIDLLASRFVCIRLDADERPEVDVRYGIGAWPATVFLTPDGDPIATTSETAVGPFLAAAAEVLDDWATRRDEVLQQVEAARAMRAAERATSLASRGPGILTPEVLDVALQVLDSRYEDDPPGLLPDAPVEGDLREPHPDVLRLWRYAYHRRGLGVQFNRAFELARALAEGGLYDDRGGGFFRAALAGWVDATPEKLARPQGALLVALAEIAASDDEARDELEEAITGTATYLLQRLADLSGAVAFASSGAARDGGDAPDLTEGPERADESELVEEIDPRVFTASAAAAARGLLVAGVYLDRRDWVERGLRGVDFLLARVRAGEAGMYHAWDQAGPRHFGILDDQAEMLLALLTAYEVSGQASYFEQARRLARVVERDWHEPGLGFRDLPPEHEDTGLLAEPRYPLAVNVATAEGFLWIGRLTHDERYLEVAQDALSAFAHGLEGRGLAVADYARVVDRLLSAEPEFKIVAEYPPGEPDAVADPLHRAALRLPLAGRTVQRFDRTADFDLMRQVGLPDVAKVAYVCTGRTCSPALTDPEQLLPAVEDLLDAPHWSRGGASEGDDWD
jgi:uncharacterized protein